MSVVETDKVGVVVEIDVAATVVIVLTPPEGSVKAVAGDVGGLGFGLGLEALSVDADDAVVGQLQTR